MKLFSNINMLYELRAYGFFLQFLAVGVFQILWFQISAFLFVFTIMCTNIIKKSPLKYSLDQEHLDLKYQIESSVDEEILKKAYLYDLEEIRKRELTFVPAIKKNWVFCITWIYFIASFLFTLKPVFCFFNSKLGFC